MELKFTAQREGKLSSFLLGEMKLSASLMNKLKWGDSLRVNGVPQRTNYPVAVGDVITVALSEEEPEYPAEDGPLTVLYEDSWLLAVDKPAGMLIHPSRSKNDGTLANLVTGYYRRNGENWAFHPQTRLDRDTFGIVLLAKNAYTHTLLQQQKIRKTYHALTFGWRLPEEGVIEAPIARKPLPSLLREISPEGKPSVTSYCLLERQGEVCRMALQPITGRTHQLRLHCAHVGHPILGDPQYGSPESLALSEKMGLHGQQLCAKRLEFAHPITGEVLVLESEMDV